MMKEIKDIVSTFHRVSKVGLKTALATVVLVEGSAYRRSGARMLITEDGNLTGAISGGCLEGDALRKARYAMEKGEAMLVTYDTTDDDDAKIGIGLGCNGIIHILIEPIDTSRPDNPMAILNKLISKRQNAVIVTLFSLTNRKGFQPGTCLLLTGDNEMVDIFNYNHYQEQLITDAANVLNNEQSVIKTITTPGADYTCFIEFIKPGVSLVIVGAGNDAIPLAQIANVLGWECTVIDGRPNYVTQNRFAFADNLKVAKASELTSLLKIDAQTFFVLMTHNYNYEYELLKHLLGMPLTYIGVLGPRKKLQRMLNEFDAEGIHFRDEDLHNVYSPVGLDIGAEGAEEIALAIAAEIKAVLGKKEANSLKNKLLPIHLGSI